MQFLVSEKDVALYNDLKFLHDRMKILINRLMSDELTFLIYKVGQKDKTNEKMRDLSKVLVRLISILKENEGLELHRI